MNNQKNKFNSLFSLSIALTIVSIAMSGIEEISNSSVYRILSICSVISVIIFFPLFCGEQSRIDKVIKQKNEEYINSYSAHTYGHIKHFSGLPIASGAKIELFIGNDKITFKKDGQEISLDRSKVISVDYVQGKDANNQAMAGAVAGSMIGGVSGAFLGSMLAKEYYLIFTYKSEGEIKFISLSTGGSNLPINKIISDFKSSGKQIEERIEL